MSLCVESGHSCGYSLPVVPGKILVASCIALTGCALQLHSADEGPDQGSWSYGQVGATAPSASFGIANTAVQLSLECDPAEEVLHLLTIDTEILEDRAVEVRVANESFQGFERLDPPDGFAVARISIPLQEPVLATFAAGAGPLVVISGNEAWTMPHGPEPVKMVQDCLRSGP